LSCATIHLSNQFLEAKVLLRNRRRIESIGFDDIRARRQILSMNLFDYLWLSQIENIVIVLQAGRMTSKAVATVIFLLETKPLDHRTHGSVEDQDALGERV